MHVTRGPATARVMSQVRLDSSVGPSPWLAGHWQSAWSGCRSITIPSRRTCKLGPARGVGLLPTDTGTRCLLLGDGIDWGCAGPVQLPFHVARPVRVQIYLQALINSAVSSFLCEAGEESSQALPEAVKLCSRHIFGERGAPARPQALR